MPTPPNTVHPNTAYFEPALSGLPSITLLRNNSNSDDEWLGLFGLDLRRQPRMDVRRELFGALLGLLSKIIGLANFLCRSPDQLKQLIFTHGHPDHIGSAAAIVRETGVRTYMHPLDIPMAESGGPFRPMRGAPGLLRQLMCKLFYHPDEQLEPVAIDQPLTLRFGSV
jgi:hypothetical protein